MPGSDLGDQLGDDLGDSPGSNARGGGQPTSLVSPTDLANVGGQWLKSGDTGPALTATLVDQNGPVDLTAAASVVLRARGLYTSTSITGVATVLDAAAGAVAYNWAPEDTATADTYRADLVVTFNSGEVVSFPDADDLRIYIAPAVV